MLDKVKNYYPVRFKTKMWFHAKGQIKTYIIQLSHCFSKYRRLLAENDASDVIWEQNLLLSVKQRFAPDDRKIIVTSR